MVNSTLRCRGTKLIKKNSYLLNNSTHQLKFLNINLQLTKGLNDLCLQLVKVYGLTRKLSEDREVQITPSANVLG